MNRPTLWFAVGVILIGATPHLPVLAQNPPESPAEYQVYEAVLGLMNQIPKPDLRVSIYNVTLNNKCGEEAYPSPLANGCTFLWMKPDTPDTVKKLLLEDCPDLENSTWSDFEARSSVSVTLHEPLATPWPHRMVGPDAEPSKDWESPDLTIFLSRVGFNQKKNEAVVFVLIFSYLEGVPTAGDYFVFRTDKDGKWVPKGRVRYFTQENKAEN